MSNLSLQNITRDWHIIMKMKEFVPIINFRSNNEFFYGNYAHSSPVPCLDVFDGKINRLHWPLFDLISVTTVINLKRLWVLLETLYCFLQ